MHTVVTFGIECHRFGAQRFSIEFTPKCGRQYLDGPPCSPWGWGHNGAHRGLLSFPLRSVLWNQPAEYSAVVVVQELDVGIEEWLALRSIVADTILSQWMTENTFP